MRKTDTQERFDKLMQEGKTEAEIKQIMNIADGYFKCLRTSYRKRNGLISKTNRFEDFCKLIESGKSKDEIMREMGFGSTITFNTYMCKYNKKVGAFVSRKREEVPSNVRDAIIELLKKDVSIVKIMKRLNLKLNVVQEVRDEYLISESEELDELIEDARLFVDVAKNDDKDHYHFRLNHFALGWGRYNVVFKRFVNKLKKGEIL